MHHYSKLFCSALVTTLLAGCGGGSGGGGLGSTPTPPASSQNATLTNLTVSDTFIGAATVSKFTVAKPSGAASVVQNGSQGGTFSPANVNYNASTKTYSVNLAGLMQDASFGETDRNVGKSNAILSVYERTSGNKNESFVLFNPGSANTKFALTYTSYGAYQVITDGVSQLGVNTAFFTFGVKTSAADMPRIGTATYTTTIDGQYADGSGVYALGGGSGFTADFGTSTFSYTLSPVGTHVVNGSTKVLPTFAGSGTIEASGARFGTNGAIQSNGMGSNLLGYFYGPNAAELGAVFSLETIGGIGGGALVGKKN